MISGIEKSTSSSVNEEIKDIIMSSYTQDELFQALLFSDLLEEVLSPIDVQALEDRSTEIKIRDAYFNYCNGKTDIVDMDKNSAYNLLDRYGEGLLGPDDEGLFLIGKTLARMTAAQPSTYPKKPLPRVRHPIDSPKKSVRSPAHAKKALSATADQRTEV